jgi:PilZ domain
MSEARTGKRFPLELPIRIHRKGGDEGATTADLSAAGVYIMAETDLAVGSPIEFDITLPAEVLGTPADVEVRCSGRVVRKESGAGANAGKKKKKSGVACVIDQYQFIRKGKGSR